MLKNIPHGLVPFSHLAVDGVYPQSCIHVCLRIADYAQRMVNLVVHEFPAPLSKSRWEPVSVGKQLHGELIQRTTYNSTPGTNTLIQFQGFVEHHGRNNNIYRAVIE